MAKSTAKGFYTPKNPNKYNGHYPITYRSRWELDFMKYCDDNPDVLEWAREFPREGIKYIDPLTGRSTIYIPDFFIKILDAQKVVRQKLIEIKPMHEQLSEFARNTTDAAIQAKNRAKWGAAMSWCMRRGAEFVIMNESNIYRGHENRVGRLHPVHQYAPAQNIPKKKAPSNRPRKPAQPAKPRKPKVVGAKSPKAPRVRKTRSR